MHIEKRVHAFVALGKYLAQMPQEEIENLCLRARAKNSWFTPENIQKSLAGVVQYTEEKSLRDWLQKYPDTPMEPKKVAIVMAGNIPLVGFHDFLCVLLSGHSVMVRPSNEDEVLITEIIKILVFLEPQLQTFIQIVERINDAEKVIATGSDNTARYFDYYFAKKPHIVRKNRVSLAVLNGSETKQDFEALGEDIFTYFGLGCRNVAKIYVPQNYDFTLFFQSMEAFSEVKNHHKYFNNYEYNKSIYLLKPVIHLDNGFLLLSETTEIASSVACLHYEFYNNEKDLEEKIKLHQEKIQCIVSKDAFWAGSHAFGQAQKPSLAEYADGVDTMQFLLH